jgi:hypothetical protein
MATAENPKLKWSTLLSQVVNNYNNTLHFKTGFTSSYLLFGKDNLCTNVPHDEARRLAPERSKSFKVKKKETYDRSQHP